MSDKKLPTDVVRKYKLRLVQDPRYVKHGYMNRSQYLSDLADQFGLDEEVVFSIADMLGESEDFDGLVTELEDFDGFGW